MSTTIDPAGQLIGHTASVSNGEAASEHHGARPGVSVARRLLYRAARRGPALDGVLVKALRRGEASVDWLFIVKPAGTVPDGGSSAKDRMLELVETAPRREWCLSR
ncbi:hypothetical protein GCM10010365_24010 [Streptomyces poonensis]|uniref:Uncharacterized protein n=1 Tax=Streptomyces poonensis TaxID=68255 RepID=A0A918UG47_9ACTN|nr:hypothetical protein GCM10010365_24010 [Streptomyces poonensis]GLJ89345.1 hypothetical protein GCM10017589_19450 [Streptomyces poonensis]